MAFRFGCKSFALHRRILPGRSPFHCHLMAMTPHQHFVCGPVEIESSPIEPLTSSTQQAHSQAEAGHLIKKWAVKTSREANAPLQLAIDVPGLVFLRRMPPQQSTGDKATPSPPPPPPAARVEFTGDSTQLLECIDVQTAHNVLQVSFRRGSRWNAGGNLFGEIFVRADTPVASLNVVGNTTVVVQEEDVLATSDKHQLTINCIGKTAKALVSLPNQLHLQSLAIQLTGEGTVQIQTPALRVEQDMQLNLMGQGNLLIATKSLQCNGSLTSRLTGTAALDVATQQFHVKLAVKVHTTGESHVYLGAQSGRGHCESLEFTCVGQNSLDAGTIKSEDVAVHPTGEARAVVQAVESLEVTGWSHPSVEYVGEKPQTIESNQFVKYKVVRPVAESYNPPEDPTANESKCPLKPLPGRQLMPVKASKWFNLSSWMGLS